MRDVRFADRRAAGRALGDRLATMELADPVVLGLARGGVVVAAEVARVLGADLDVLVVRKVGHPHHPELGLGALAEDGEPVFDESGLLRARLSVDDLAGVVAAERAEAGRRLDAYRGDRPGPVLAGRDVLVVDDGIATGVTARAAIRSVRSRGAARIVLAAPVASGSAVEVLSADADDVVVLQQPAWFGAVSRHYREFDQTSDEEVLRLLR